MISLRLQDIDDVGIYDHYAERGFYDLWFRAASRQLLYQEWRCIVYYEPEWAAKRLLFETEQDKTMFLLRWPRP